MTNSVIVRTNQVLFWTNQGIFGTNTLLSMTNSIVFMTILVLFSTNCVIFWYFTNCATCPWLSLFCPWLSLSYPWLSLPYPWLSLLYLCQSLLSPWLLMVALVVPGLSLAVPKLDKRILMLHFTVFVWPWLRQELNSIYQGSRKDWCWLTCLQWLYKCDLCLQRWQDIRDFKVSLEIIININMKRNLWWRLRRRRQSECWT